MDKRKEHLATRIGGFMRQYECKADKNRSDPNDRQYDRKLERRIKKMDPAELDEMMHGPLDDGPEAERSEAKD